MDVEAVAGYRWVRPHEQEKLDDVQMAAFLSSFHAGFASNGPNSSALRIPTASYKKKPAGTKLYTRGGRYTEEGMPLTVVPLNRAVSGTESTTGVLQVIGV